MNRTDIEIKLNQERAWTLETSAALPPAELERDITTSKPMRDNITAGSREH